MKKTIFQDKFVNHLWRILPPFPYTRKTSKSEIAPVKMTKKGFALSKIENAQCVRPPPTVQHNEVVSIFSQIHYRRWCFWRFRGWLNGRKDFWTCEECWSATRNNGKERFLIFENCGHSDRRTSRPCLRVTRQGVRPGHKTSGLCLHDPRWWGKF